MEPFKLKVARRFSRSSGLYNEYAVAQHASANFLAQRVDTLTARLPFGPVLEVGCGTGRLSAALVSIMPERQFVFTDLSAGMINLCRDSLLSSGVTPANLSWKTMDAEEIKDRNRFALVVSGLTMQWFENVEQTMGRFSQALIPEGYFLCSYLGAESFPEWRERCLSLGLPCTVNALLDNTLVNKYARNIFKNVECFLDKLPVTYNSAKDFFSSLKKTGTNTVDSGKTLSHGQMKKLLKNWDDHCHGQPVTVTYYVHTILTKK